MTVSTVDSTSAYERIAADYPLWCVTHVGDDPGQWVASRQDVAELVVATTVDRLLTRLEIAELERLKAQHHREWVVWRSKGGSWMATARMPNVAPTLMCGSPSTWRVGWRTRTCGVRVPRARRDSGEGPTRCGGASHPPDRPLPSLGDPRIQAG